MDRFNLAVTELRRLSAEDPSREQGQPRELLHADRLSEWLERIAPEASEALRLSAYCQHFLRFKWPRSRFPEGREGYLRWRKEAQVFHAAEAEKVLRTVGYGDDMVEAVRRIVQKRNLKHDRDVQVMEDVLCLSFLEHELGAFAAKHDDEKVVHILKTTWRKMSTDGQVRARELSADLPANLQTLLARALANAS